jgi:hypothetical protein
MRWSDRVKGRQWGFDRKQRILALGKSEVAAERKNREFQDHPNGSDCCTMYRVSVLVSQGFHTRTEYWTAMYCLYKGSLVVCRSRQPSGRNVLMFNSICDIAVWFPSYVENWICYLSSGDLLLYVWCHDGALLKTCRHSCSVRNLYCPLSGLLKMSRKFGPAAFLWWSLCWQ